MKYSVPECQRVTLYDTILHGSMISSNSSILTNLAHSLVFVTWLITFFQSIVFVTWAIAVWTNLLVTCEGTGDARRTQKHSRSSCHDWRLKRGSRTSVYYNVSQMPPSKHYDNCFSYICFRRIWKSPTNVYHRYSSLPLQCCCATNDFNARCKLWHRVRYIDEVEALIALLIQTSLFNFLHSNHIITLTMRVVKWANPQP